MGPVLASSDMSGLYSLLAHDMRAPLGPLTLATSSLAADPALPDDAREYAQIAHSQSEKVARLLTAALVASGRLPHLRPRTVSLPGLLAETVASFAALGGRLIVGGAAVEVDADPVALGETLLNAVEVAAGSGGLATAFVAEHDGRVTMTLSCDDLERCAAAFSAETPHDADSAFALACLAVIEAHGGSVELTDDGLSLSLPASRPGR